MEYMVSVTSCIMQTWLQHVSFHRLFWNLTLMLPLQGRGSLSPLREPERTFMPKSAKSSAQTMLGLLRLEVINTTVFFSFRHSVVSNSLQPVDCIPPGSSVHRLLQARIQEWVTIPFSRGSSPLRNWTLVSCIAGRFFTIWTTWKPKCCVLLPYSFGTLTLGTQPGSLEEAHDGTPQPWLSSQHTASASLPADHLKEPPWRGIFSPWFSGWTQPQSENTWAFRINDNKINDFSVSDDYVCMQEYTSTHSNTRILRPCKSYSMSIIYNILLKWLIEYSDYL